MTSTPAPTDTSREAIERLARMLREDRHPATITKVEGSPCNPLGEKASDALIALLERAEAAEKRTQRDCGEEACPYLVKANLALSVARADAERLRDALQEIEIAEPDADGIVWLKIKLHSGTGAMVNLGTIERLTAQVGVLWNDHRRAALTPTEPKP